MQKYLIILCLLIASSVYAMDSASITNAFLRIEDELSLIQNVRRAVYYPQKGESRDSILEKVRQKAKDPNKIQKDKEANGSELAFYVEWLAKQYGADVIRVVLHEYKTDAKIDTNLDTKKHPKALEVICYVGFKDKGLLVVRSYCNGVRRD